MWRFKETNLGEEARNNQIRYPGPCQSSKNLIPRNILEAYAFVNKLYNLNDPWIYILTIHIFHLIIGQNKFKETINIYHNKQKIGNKSILDVIYWQKFHSNL